MYYFSYLLQMMKRIRTEKKKEKESDASRHFITCCKRDRLENPRLFQNLQMLYILQHFIA